MPQCCSSTMRLSQTHVHANGDDVWTWRKISNPRPVIAEPAYITLGRVADLRHNLTVYRIPWRVRVGSWTAQKPHPRLSPILPSQQTLAGMSGRALPCHRSG